MRKVGWLVAALLCLSVGAEAQTLGEGSIGYGHAPLDLSSPAQPTYWTDFLYSISEAGFSAYNATSTDPQASEVSHPGMVRLVPNGASVFSALYGSGAAGPLAGEIEYMRWDVRCFTAANVPTNRIGMMTNVTSAPANGLYFEHLTTDTNWFAVTRASSAETRVDTGVAFASNTHIAFEILPEATRVAFKINGVAVASITTTMPTVALFPEAQVVTTGTLANLDVDFFKLRLKTARLSGT